MRLMDNEKQQVARIGRRNKLQRVRIWREVNGMVFEV